MTETEAAKHGWKCPECGEYLKEVRGVYYCEKCTIEEALNEK